MTWIHDTHPDAEQTQIRMLREIGEAGRFKILTSMTDRCRKLARQAIADNFPELSPLEQKVKFVEIHYNQELAEGFRQRLIQDEQE